MTQGYVFMNTIQAHTQADADANACYPLFLLFWCEKNTCKVSLSYPD